MKLDQDHAQQWHNNSLAPEKCVSNFKSLISNYMLQIKFSDIAWEIALKWMPKNTFGNKSAFVQAMACCVQAKSHYLTTVETDLGH